MAVANLINGAAAALTAGAGYMLPLLKALLEETDRQATKAIYQFQKDSNFETVVSQ